VTHHDSTATRWYPDVVRLASYLIEEVRNTDAWVMGQDSTSKRRFQRGIPPALSNAERPFLWCAATRRCHWCVSAMHRKASNRRPAARE
jgi:hypothetical protein